MPRFVELNHILRHDMDPFPSLPRPVIGAIWDHEQSRPRYQNKAEFYLGKVDMPCNIGSYLDSPFHRFPEGDDLSRLPLEKVAGLAGVVFDADVASDRSARIQASAKEVAGRAVLVRTAWDRRWGTAEYWQPGPYLSAETLDVLIEGRATMVAVDFWNVDDTGDLARPAHTRLLKAGVLIAENLANFAALPPAGFRFYAVPLRIERGASFPVRAFAELPD